MWYTSVIIQYSINITDYMTFLSFFLKVNTICLLYMFTGVDYLPWTAFDKIKK